MQQFGRHVIGRADDGLCELGLGAEELRHSEVTELDISRLRSREIEGD